MNIVQMQIGNIVNPLVGEPVKVSVGQTLRVSYSFSYKVAETTNVSIWASLYHYVGVILDRISQAQTKSTITLEKSLEWQTYSGEIDIAIGDMKAGVYGLLLELRGYTDAKIDDCIEIAGGSSITDMMPMLMMVMMMGMVMPMLEEE